MSGKCISGFTYGSQSCPSVSMLKSRGIFSRFGGSAIWRDGGKLYGTFLRHRPIKSHRSGGHVIGKALPLCVVDMVKCHRWKHWDLVVPKVIFRLEIPKFGGFTTLKTKMAGWKIHCELKMYFLFQIGRILWCHVSLSGVYKLILDICWMW